MFFRSLLTVSILALCGCANMGVVEDGRVYRSAQLSGEDLSEIIARHGIRSVLNLRGKRPGHDWYREELAACRRAGIPHYTVRMSAQRWPRVRELTALLDVFAEGEYPMLIHCRAGADRTGLAAAMYRIAEKGHEPKDAADELTIAHGHLGWIGGTGELDEFVQLYERTGNGKDLRRWVLEDYRRERAKVE